MTRVRNALADLRQPREEIELQIKVTGYLDTTEMDPAYVDESHETGLSNLGYERYYGGEAIEGLDDLDFKAVKNT